MKKTLILLTCTMLIISGCGRPGGDDSTDDTQGESTTKKEYIVQTSKIRDISTTPSITKSGKIIGESDVSVTAQASGRVRTISFAEGDAPAKGAVVLVLDDSNNQFNYSAQRAREGLEAARLNYDSTQINLDNTLVDLELNLKNAQQQYSAAKEDAQQQLRDNEQQLLDTEQQLKDNAQQLLDAQQQIADAEQQRIAAEYAAKTNNPDDVSGSANLQLQKFDNDIKKAEFDYETRLEADAQQLEGFVNSASVIQDTILNTYTQVLEGIDRILGVTDNNRTANDSFEQYLSSQNTQYKIQATAVFRQLKIKEAQLVATELDVNQVEEVGPTLTSLESSLDELEGLLYQMEDVLGHTSLGNFLNQQQLDALKAQIDGYQAQVAGQYGSVVSQINGIDTFLATYIQNQQSLLKNIELLREQRDITAQQLRDASINAGIAAERAKIGGDRTEIAVNRTNIGSERSDIAIQRTKIGLERANLQIQNTVTNAELALESAKNALAANQKTKSVTLASLQNAIDQAQIAYNEAVANASKLTVTAPIQGSIADVFVDIGEEVNPGTPLFDITNLDKQEVVISLSADEKDQIIEGKKVKVLQGEKTYNGTVDSIADIADDQLLYKTTVKLDQLSDRLGDIVSVQIPLTSSYTLLPLDLVTMQTSKSGSIRVRNGQEPEQTKVELGDVRGESIEIKSRLGNSMEIITSAMDKYDKNVFDAQKQATSILDRQRVKAADEIVE